MFILVGASGRRNVIITSITAKFDLMIGPKIKAKILQIEALLPFPLRGIRVGFIDFVYLFVSIK